VPTQRALGTVRAEYGERRRLPTGDNTCFDEAVKGSALGYVRRSITAWNMCRAVVTAMSDTGNDSLQSVSTRPRAARSMKPSEVQEGPHVRRRAQD